MLSRRHEIALLHPDLDRVLVLATADGPALPSLTEAWPDHRDLVAAVGDPTAFLATPPERRPDGQVTDVLLGGAPDPAVAGGLWLDLDEATTVLPAASVRAIGRAVTDLRDGPPDDGRAAWYRPGWRAQVDAWVAQRLDELDAVPDGPAEAVKIWSLSAVLRIPARRRGAPAEFWFKATCEGFRTEPTLTAAVRRFAPGHTPQVHAIDEARAWMLMAPIPPGGQQAEPDPPVLTRAVEAARTLARLQVASLDHLDDLLAAGLPDRGLEATLGWLDTVIGSSVELPLMTALQQASARALGPWLAEQVRAIFDLGLPLTLVHGDLHLGNTARTPSGPLLYDWTDACLSHPWFDARHLATSAGAEVYDEDRAAVVDAVRNAYEEPWRAAFPAAVLDRAWALSGVAESVFTLISYEQIYRAQPSSSRWELATVVVEILDKLAVVREEGLRTAGPARR